MAAKSISTSPVTNLSGEGECVDAKDTFVVTLSGPEEGKSSNPFADADVAAHYRDLYEHARYECRHVFDPSLDWTWQEERKLVRKLDWHVCLWAVGCNYL